MFNISNVFQVGDGIARICNLNEVMAVEFVEFEEYVYFQDYMN